MKRVVLFHTLEEALKVVPLGEKRKFRIDGELVCIANHASGWLAFDDACPHLGHSLTEGHFNSFQEIVCPWHSFRFHVQTGEEAERRCTNLKIYKITPYLSGLALYI